MTDGRRGAKFGSELQMRPKRRHMCECQRWMQTSLPGREGRGVRTFTLYESDRGQGRQ